jgi:hypothetical protein
MKTKSISIQRKMCANRADQPAEGEDTRHVAASELGRASCTTAAECTRAPGQLLLHGKHRHILYRIHLLLFVLCVHGGVSAADEVIATNLVAQGLSEDAILEIHNAGIPVICGTGRPVQPAFQITPAAVAALPPQTRGYEVIPTVIRSDGRDSCRLEVNVNGPVSSVVLVKQAPFLAGEESRRLTLRDDGLAGDRVSGDHIFTSESIYHNTAVWGQPNYFWRDTNSPKGLEIHRIGTLEIVETDGVTNEFLISPAVGLLNTDIATCPPRSLGTNFQATHHLVNIRTSRRTTQRFIRLLDSEREQLTREFYSVMPDAYDFLMLFSIDHVEKVPPLNRDNFIAGVHASVRVGFLGTGHGTYDESAYYGSAGRLQGINALDTLDRGIYAGNAIHELLHQWCAYIDFSFGLSDDAAHWSFRSNAGSLLGGTRWIEGTDDSFTVDCSEGRGGAHFASPIDKYMMGLVNANQVPLLHAFGSSIDRIPCGGVVSNVPVTVSITDIQQRHGVREPGPARAQRDFSIGFIAESHDRFLTPTEMTFYEILAEHFTKPLSPDAPAPYAGFNWVPIGKFFGEGTTWTSSHPSVPQPGLVNVDCAYAGTDSDGSITRPFRTIREAYDAACNGDTLRIFPCNYPETFTLSKPLRLEAPNGGVNIGR